MAGKKKKGRKQAKTSRRPPGSLAAVDGRMPEQQGRRFYGLLSVLAMIAVPKLNAKRQSMAGTIDWHPDMGSNSMEAREIVMSYILQEIDWLVDEMESGRYDDMFRQCLGRRLSEADKADVRSWKLHVEDDFFVMDNKEYEGTAFVQVGRLQHHDHLKDAAPDFVEGDYHEPRCFVVQGLADPIQKMMKVAIQDFQHRHPSLELAYPELKNMCLIHTALLPYNGGITYMTTMKPPQGRHYQTPQDMAAATQVAVHTYQAAFQDDTEENTVALYRTLDPAKDAAICRLASDPFNQWLPTAMRRVDQAQKHASQKKEQGTTSMMIHQMFWNPDRDRNHPQFMTMLERATAGPKPFLVEGMKNMVTEEILVKDEDLCPFHKRFGEDNASFKDCCKRKYLERMLKAKRPGNAMKMHIMYNPVEGPEIAKINESVEPGQPFHVMQHVRIGYQDIGKIRLEVPTQYVSLIKDRMDTCDLYHSSMPYKWIYWGYIPINMREIGVMTFGDITLDPRTGVFEGDGMTSARITSLIREMKHLCTNIPILSASLEMQPSPKVKPDQKALEKNRELLQEGLEVTVNSKIDKEVNEGMCIRCGFCGCKEGDGVSLMRCACKSSYYCCKDHQRAHWKDHKEECKRLRGA